MEIQTAKQAVDSSKDALEQTKRIYGTTLLMRGSLWMLVYATSRWLLPSVDGQVTRVAIALLPLPFFAWFLSAWAAGLARMDELERRIELEALAFALPVSAVFLSTFGLLDAALTLDPNAFSLRGSWLILPLLYYIGLWRAQRRYR